MAGIASFSQHNTHIVVTLVVLTERALQFSSFINQLLAKAIPVRGARFIKGLRMQPFAFQNTFRKPFQNILFATLHKKPRLTISRKSITPA
ncbi:hypothetical protein MJO48_09035 [Dickeya fangzhongdai]|uniref:hypothetical protein n=1 Tax=Dickeya fangzhongdai TaxID=1778540 RepID=UPI001EFB6280|nr:hypothetical protein [Dickeya fangzhongdai]ULR32792.1 hypothetical protein MJO48_09035 [Dickeya fangzhongdai]